VSRSEVLSEKRETTHDALNGYNGFALFARSVGIVLDSMEDAALVLNVAHLIEYLFCDHLQSPGGCND
jgi:hypothetical protein